MTGVVKLDYNYRQHHDVARPVTWRFDKVKRKMASGEPLHPKRDDQVLHILRKYYHFKQRLQRQHEDPEDAKDELAARFKHVWAADSIFALGQQHRARFTIEASILARSPIEHICKRFSVTPETIDFYEQAFFNVKDRLDSRGYIASTVIAPAFMAGLSSRSQEMTAKYFGYFGGPHVLDMILDAFTDEIPPPNEASELSNWISDQFRARIRANAMVAVTYLEPNNMNVRTLLEGFQALLSLSTREQASAGDDNVINRALQAFMQNNPVPRGDDADALPARPGLLYGGGAVEPRVHELESAARGVIPDSLVKYERSDWQNPATQRISNATTDLGQDSK